MLHPLRMTNGLRARAAGRLNQIRRADSVPEILEARRLMSAITLGNGVLTLTGDANVSNSLTVEYVASNNQIHAAIGASHYFVPRGLVSSVRVYGSTQNDRVYINPAISAPSSIQTYGGTDSVNGGNGADTIDLGSGSDAAHGWGGNDTILGGDGNDVIYGDDGNDRVDGGNDNDRLSGGNNDDIVLGGAGDDIL